MQSLHRGPVFGLFGQLALLAALSATVGLGAAGWGVGVLSALIMFALLVRAVARRGTAYGPADWITAFRAVLAGGAAALVPGMLASGMLASGMLASRALAEGVSVGVLVGFAAATIVLDGVDGRVARRTRTTSDLGARFDMEVDAFLILALSVRVAELVGGWVLAIGLARYAFLAAGWFLPWLRADSPPRYWAKVVAVVQGVALTAAAANVLPHRLMAAILLGALVLLAESFGRQCRWLWRHRKVNPGAVEIPAQFLTALSGLLVWVALLLPANLLNTTPGSFAAIPLAGLVLVLTALVLPRRWRQVVAVIFGALLAVVLLAKALNTAFEAVFDRPFDLLNDGYYLGPGAGVLGDSLGGAGAAAVLAAAVLFVAFSLFLFPVAALRLQRAASMNRRVWAGSVLVAGAAWVVFFVSGTSWGPCAPLASSVTAAFVSTQFQQVQHDAADRHVFAAQISHDPFMGPQSAAPEAGLLQRLRGKDVLLVFVESYGRAAVEGSSFSPGVRAVLESGTSQLHHAGFDSRSAFLTSPTFGGASWLAHSTLQSGLWVDSQQRYNQLLTTQRPTLSSAFQMAGWRTVSFVPADTRDWPQGQAFYGFDALYDSRNVGYGGPKFGYASMPDQYVLSAFQRLERSATSRRPVMAELDLVSSHTPWTPLPRFVPWNEVGAGTIFNSAAGRAPGDAGPGDAGAGNAGPGNAGPGSPTSIDAGAAARYGKSIEYTLGTIFSFVVEHPDPGLVLIVVGDHQPNASVSGPGSDHDVPISIIARDTSILADTAGWGWVPGMLPGPEAPVWLMSTFRDKFLEAYSVSGVPGTAAPAVSAVPGAAVVHSTAPHHPESSPQSPLRQR